ncbi:MAG: FAD-dependent oxidoreductase [Rhodospirillales bacterium]|jgi:formate dehydrogenase major subunit|nr:4Fe-4S ferredoxin [Rhodospirillaceae bacterium]MDP7097058.1 FAD-dependent oxidoreductase [Rhodospirillales bacterium]HJN23191.1 FAD-dependent oxidoreductase [Rhodospirillales bacterium]
MSNGPTGKIYLDEDEDFSGTQAFGRRVVTSVRYSTDPRDIGWVKKNVPCQTACPADTNVPAYISMISEQQFGRSYELNRLANVLPGVLGRICSRPCEDKCRHGWPGNGDPVGICHLKRVAADFKPFGHRISETLFTPSGKHIAIVGGGPTGIAAAHDLTTLGHDVTIYEREDKPGGMLAYGIPEFRLPRDMLEVELRNAIRLGVDLKTGVSVGHGDNDIPLAWLRDNYDAVLLATGCMAATRLPLDGSKEGRDLARVTPGVEYGLDFLIDLHRGVKKTVGKKVFVVGAGFTALDCARVARRSGSEDVTIHLRTTEEYIPVTKEEIFQAKREGVNILGLRTPVGLITGAGGESRGVRFIQNRLGGWRKNGRRQAIPIEGSEFEESCDTLIIAIGQKTITDYLDQPVKLDSWKSVKIGEDGMTSINGMFAAGDFVNGPTTAIDAIGHGRAIALKMDAWLMGRVRRKQVVKVEAVDGPLHERSFDFISRQEMPTTPLKGRFRGPSAEVEKGLGIKQASEEAKRCYLCNHRYEIDIDNCIYCRACIEVAPRNCIKLVEGIEIKKDGTYGDLREAREWDKVGAIWIDNNECIRCSACYKVCPTKCISITNYEISCQDISGKKGKGK